MRYSLKRPFKVKISNNIRAALQSSVLVILISPNKVAITFLEYLWATL